ncbi:hypothetical protein F8M41_014790 [Gigaspora margarita]|uniref:Uncharacterized protein n=1 Tax=Gigaspora margarita TaxID=4874 RepID=A0A8H4ENU2_GIGMA|nr:hypothetical protein F8M41_014790 [Gigaspora margarita]
MLCCYELSFVGIIADGRFVAVLWVSSLVSILLPFSRIIYFGDCDCVVADSSFVGVIADGHFAAILWISSLVGVLLPFSGIVYCGDCN